MLHFTALAKKHFLFVCASVLSIFVGVGSMGLLEFSSCEFHSTTDTTSLPVFLLGIDDNVGWVWLGRRMERMMDWPPTTPRLKLKTKTIDKYMTQPFLNFHF